MYRKKEIAKKAFDQVYKRLLKIGKKYGENPDSIMDQMAMVNEIYSLTEIFEEVYEEGRKQGKEEGRKEFWGQKSN